MKALVLAALTALVFFVSVEARAHETRTAEIDIDAMSDTAARVTVRGALVLEAPPGCRFDPPPTPSGVLQCPGGLAGRVLDVAGADVAFVRIRDRARGDATAVVTKNARTITLPGTPARSDVVTRYLRLGVEHVLSGVDHVLFLVALFFHAWSGRRVLRELARTATAFTLGHSVTLAATMLGVLHVRAEIAEACIAWSLVLVALDLGRGARRTTAPLAAAFGLVHGLGFAGAIAATRLPDAARWTALLAFNLGIEGGQLLVFGAGFAVVMLLRRTPAPVLQRAPAVAAYVVGVPGAAMFLVRALSIFR